MITLNNIVLRRGANILLNGVTWSIFQRQRIGIIGANGTGKSSLFAMLLGQLAPDTGELKIPKQMTLAHVAQETPAYAASALDYVLDGDKELRDLERQLLAAETEHDGVKIGELHAKLNIIDGYSAPARAAQLLDGLGFQYSDHAKPVSGFSGGWRMRLNLAKALMCRSDVLLLDEPTNHLDLDAVLWLEQWLAKYQGTLVLISHDRDFLDATVDHIAHIAHQQLKLYTGNYSTFEKTRATELEVQQAAFEKQQKQIAHMRDYVERFRYKATKARQAQSRLKAIERMDLVLAVQADSEFQFEFKQPGHCPNPLLQVNKARVQYGEKMVLEQLNFSISPKQRIAVLGPNGAGKSSFIKMLAGEIDPALGTVENSAGLKIGYFAQHQVDHLHLTDTPLLHLRRLAEQESELNLRKFLGGFGFIGDRVFEPVGNFSGGEKSRLALALIVWQQPNLLLLDEPTNHLDLEMRNALSIALQEYEGAMILVSHDRFLVRTTTDELLLVADGKMQAFDGDLSDYQSWLIEYRRQQQALSDKDAINKSDISRKEQRQQDAKQRELLRPLVQKIKKLEDQLAKLQKKSSEIENILTDLSLYEPNQKENLQKHLLTQAQLKKEITEIEDAWLSACEERDHLA